MEIIPTSEPAGATPSVTPGPLDEPRRPAGPPLALLLVLAVGFLPTLVLFGMGLWSKPAYRFFPLGVAAAGLLCWLSSRREPAPRCPGSGWLTASLLGLALLGLAAATVVWSPWLGAAAAIVAVLAVAHWVGGLPLVRAWLPGWFGLLILLPPPLGLDERLLGKLGSVVLALAKPLLGQFDVLHVVRRGSIEVPGKEVPLGDACVGLYFIPVVMVLALVLTTLLRRRWWHSLLVALTMPAWVLLGSVLWLTFGLQQLAGGGLDCFGGLSGVAAGGGFLLVMAGLALSMDQLVSFLIVSRRANVSGPPRDELARPTARPVAATGLGWAVAVAFAVLGLAQAVLATREFLAAPPASTVAPLPFAAALSLPPELPGWRQLTNRFSAMDDLVTPTAGAQTWHFARGELAASITVEQPLAGYQSLVADYLRAGWHTLGLASYRDGPHAAAPFVGVQLQKDSFQHGRVWFAVGEPGGKWLTPPSPAGRPGLFGQRERVVAGPTFRIQLFVSSLEALTTEEAESAEALFQIVRQQLPAQLAAQPGPPNAPFQFK